MEQKGRWRNVTSTHQESMQKSLQRYTWLIALAVMGLLLCAFFVFQAARSAEYDSHTAYVDAILGEYQVRFDNRLESDRQVLSTLAEALSKGNFTSPDGQIVLPECSQFNQLDYFPLDGDGEPQSLDLEPEVQAALEQAWQGEPAISQVFHGNGVDQIAYAVPVMDGPRILGALVGQAGLDRFTIPTGITDECAAMIMELMARDPTKRLTVEEALEHPFMYQADQLSYGVQELTPVSLKTVDAFFERDTSATNMEPVPESSLDHSISTPEIDIPKTIHEMAANCGEERPSQV